MQAENLDFCFFQAMSIVQYIVGMKQSVRSGSLGSYDLARLFFWKTIALVYAFDLDGFWNIYN